MKARQGQTRPDKARQGQTRPDKARQGQTRPDKARQGQTRPDTHAHTRPDTPRQGQMDTLKTHLPNGRCTGVSDYPENVYDNTDYKGLAFAKIVCCNVGEI